MWICPRCSRAFEKQDQPHDCAKPQTVGEYIARQDAAAQPRLREIRAILLEALPEAEELKEKAAALGLGGPYTSWRHMFCWNTLGLPLFGPAVATQRFFDTLNRVERELNRQNETAEEHHAAVI